MTVNLPHSGKKKKPVAYVYIIYNSFYNHSNQYLKLEDNCSLDVALL